MTGATGGGLALALVSTICLSWGFFRQHRAAASLPPLSVRRPVASARALSADRGWLLGFTVGLAGWAAYVAALRLAPLSLVQAVSAGGIGLLALLVRRARGAGLSPRERRGVVLAVAGLACLAASLTGTAARGGHASAGTVALWLGASLLAALLAAGPLARLAAGGAGLGLAAGVLYAAGDVATKAAVAGGAAALFTAAVLAAHGLAFVCLQLGFQRGGALTTVGLSTLATNALPIAAGMAIFGERLPGGPLGTLRVVAFVAVVAGAAYLTGVGGEEPAAASRRRRRIAGAALPLLALGAAVALASTLRGPTGAARAGTPAGIHAIRHVVFVMQENRSFDDYFGTFPGADGIPMKHGRPSVCLPDPLRHACVRPYHDPKDRDTGGPHGPAAALADIAGGRMNGFLREAVAAQAKACSKKDGARRRACVGAIATDVVGYHDAREIPNYWAWAHRYVLQDHLFEPNYGWSLPAHLWLVSGWSATCAGPMKPLTCRTELAQPAKPLGRAAAATAPRSYSPAYAWTDLTYLLARHHVSWRYYVAPGSEPDCENDGTLRCPYRFQGPTTPGIWNPLPWFTTVHLDRQVADVASTADFFGAARSGTLPAVSWVIPNGTSSEHPPSSIRAGQAWVTRVVDAVMRSPDWKSSAIFVSWDDWGGFYDNVRPPRVDASGYGLRVPGLVISPFARRGFVDHQTLSFDAYLEFVEDDFLGGARIDPKTDGRPDSRPDVRERAPKLGDLSRDFDFGHAPGSALVLPPHPKR